MLLINVILPNVYMLQWVTHLASQISRNINLVSDRYHFNSAALLDSSNQWYSNMDRGLINIVAFLDLRTVFYTIDVEILI